MVSELPPMTAITTTATSPSPIPPAPILSSSNLASGFFFDRRDSNDNWEILVWQDGAGFLSYMDGDSERKGLGRIRDVLDNAPKAKDGTPMAAVADDASFAHLFYLDEDDTVSHVFMKPGGRWKRGGLSTGGKRTAAHAESMLSAAFHHGEHDTNVVALSYQDPDDSGGEGMSLSSRTGQFAWIRTGLGQTNAPAQTLPYEFAFLIPGEGFHGDMNFDSIATNGNKTVYAKSGGNVVVFRLDADGRRWKIDGIVNTTIPKADS
ncbi:hypothetical protein V8C42DRAFT_356827 [Trichoderma barbatum]